MTCLHFALLTRTLLALADNRQIIVMTCRHLPLMTRALESKHDDSRKCSWDSALSYHVCSVLNSFASLRCGCNLELKFSNSYQDYISWAFPVKLPSGEYYKTSLMINQNNIGSGNGLVPSGFKPLSGLVLTKSGWCHMSSLDHNEFNVLMNQLSFVWMSNHRLTCCTSHQANWDSE